MNHESSRDLHDPNFEEFVKITTQQFVHLHEEQNFTICGELICKIIDLQKQNFRSLFVDLTDLVMSDLEDESENKW